MKGCCCYKIQAVLFTRTINKYVGNCFNRFNFNKLSDVASKVVLKRVVYNKVNTKVEIPDATTLNKANTVWWKIEDADKKYLMLVV